MLKQIISAIVIFLIILASSWALLHPGIFRIHDFVHGARIAEMARGLADGQFPVIWSQNFGYGYGMPLFEFYAPLPYFVGAIFYMVGLPLVVSVKLLFWICSILTAIGAYKLGSSLYGRAGGLVASAAITLAPYRAVNLYVRGAVSEAWAIMAIVWILFFSFAVVKKKKWSWFGLVISLVSLFLSHNLSTLIYVPFGVLLTIGFAVLQDDEVNIFKRFGFKEIKHISLVLSKVAGAYLISIGLASFYLLPAFFEKNYTKIEEYIVGGYFDYHLHFVYLRQFFTPFWGYGGSEWGPNDGISFFLGVGQLILLLGVGALILKQWFWKNQKKVSKRKLLFLMVTGVLLIVSLLFATEKTLYFWDSISLLKFIQFPWRMLSVSLVLIGILAPAYLLGIKSFVVRWGVAWVVLLILLVNGWMFRPEQWLGNPEALYYSDPVRIRSEMSGILPDYISVDLAEGMPAVNRLVECEECDHAVLIERSHEKLVSFNLTQPTQIIFNIAYYPGWEAQIDGNVTPIEVTDQGLISLSVPSGSTKVGLILKNTTLRAQADILSVVSVLLFAGFYLSTMYRSKLEKYGHT